MIAYDELIADVLFKHLPMKRPNPRHPTIMAAAREIESAIARALVPTITKARGES